MIFLWVVVAILFGYGVGWFSRGVTNADAIDHLEADLAAARRAARERDFNLQQKGL